MIELLLFVRFDSVFYFKKLKDSKRLLKRLKPVMSVNRPVYPFKHGWLLTFVCNVNDYNQSNVNFKNTTSVEDAHEKEARRLSPQKRCIYFWIFID